MNGSEPPDRHLARSARMIDETDDEGRRNRVQLRATSSRINALIWEDAVRTPALFPFQPVRENGVAGTWLVSKDDPELIERIAKALNLHSR